jgi:hypothetical protein
VLIIAYGAQLARIDLIHFQGGRQEQIKAWPLIFYITIELQDRIGSAQAIDHHSYDMHRKFGFLLDKEDEPLALDGQ